MKVLITAGPTWIKVDDVRVITTIFSGNTGIFLAKNFKKNVKPYSSIKVWGNITTLKNIDQVDASSDDGWGSSNPMDRVNSSYKKTFVITGADPESIEHEAYTEDKIEEALAKMNSSAKAEKEFGGDSEDWGDTKGLKDATEEDDQAPW